MDDPLGKEMTLEDVYRYGWESGFNYTGNRPEKVGCLPLSLRSSVTLLTGVGVVVAHHLNHTDGGIGP